MIECIKVMATTTKRQRVKENQNKNEIQNKEIVSSFLINKIFVVHYLSSYFKFKMRKKKRNPLSLFCFS